MEITRKEVPPTVDVDEILGDLTVNQGKGTEFNGMGLKTVINKKLAIGNTTIGNVLKKIPRKSQYFYVFKSNLKSVLVKTGLLCKENLLI